MRSSLFFLSAVAVASALVSDAVDMHGMNLRGPEESPSLPVESRDSVRAIVSKADSLQLAYRFAEAAEMYGDALSAVGYAAVTDSLSLSSSDSAMVSEIEARKLMSENGLAMMKYAAEPVVVARHRFSVEDFHLFYPLQDRSWRPVPNPLDSASVQDPYVNATYVPQDSREIYFSAADQSGVRNIYHTELKDSLWTVPALLDESVTSSGNEIHPMLSSDGKTLYFASSGLYGVGGYDLYEVRWDDSRNSWGMPVNMGFPYSSPYDDFLYMNTPDGRYTIFASNRDCPPDSVSVYVLEYDSMPVRKALETPEEVAALAELVPVDDPSRMDTGSTVQGDMPENVDTRKYMVKMEEVRALRDSIFLYGKTLETLRSSFEESQDQVEKENIEARIITMESRIPALQDSLDRATVSLQNIEMEFLFSGVVIDPDKLMAQADREVVGASTNYAFTRLSPGGAMQMVFEEPEVKFDYSFMILPEGRFAEDNTIPEGIVYQIQMFTLSKPATVAQIKGLSPVFWRKTTAGKYIYSAGLFRTYNDVLSNLNKVKRLGFKTAFITAFGDGEQIPVQKARSLEASMKPVYQVKAVPGGDALPEFTVKAIRQITDKDIAKTEEDGKVVFSVGPLDSLSEAEKLVEIIKASGILDASVVKIGNLSSK